MRIPDGVFKLIKSHLWQFIQKTECKLEFDDNLWVPFFDKPKSDVVVFAIFTFQIYKILVEKWKHGIIPTDIITFNVELEIISRVIIELVNIYESSHEEAIVISRQKQT